MLSNNRQAETYALIDKAHEDFTNFLTAIGDIDLEDEELGEAAGEIGRLLLQAKKNLDV
jgi:hypothetical protein